MPNNIPDWRITLNGADLSPKIRPRLISLSLSERRSAEADELTLVLDDSDHLLAIPPEGATLALSLGWLSGAEVTPGLVDKGAFRVDDVTHAGPPDQITIRARSADFAGEIRNRRSQGWENTTLGAILTEVAGRNGLATRIAPALAAIAVLALQQTRESDVAFLARLGAEHDAVATIKKATLIFAPKGAGKTASGAALPTIRIARDETSSHSWQRQARETEDGAAASWHDKDAAEQKEVKAGAGKKKLPKIYPDEASARAAANAEAARLKRTPATLSLRLALGRPDAAPESRLQVTGIKPEIDSTTWLITESAHTLDKYGGFQTDLKCETAAG